MPIPYEPPPSPTPVEPPPITPVVPPDLNPYQLPDPRRYAIDQERQRHNDALFRYGEYAMFVLMWTIRDFDEDRVDRCTRCFANTGLNQRIAETYKQPNQGACPVCFGTTFEGGFRAKVIRPSLWDFSEDADSQGRRGATISATAGVQSTADFQMHTGDYAFRADGTRWKLLSLSAHHMREGFEAPFSTTNIIAVNAGNFIKEPPTATSFTIPPTGDVLATLLDPQNPRFPVDYSANEIIRSPLLEAYG